MIKKEVEEESFDLGSGTESALLDYQIDLTSQMSMQSIRSLINLIRKLFYQSQKKSKGAQQIECSDRRQIRQLADQVTLDVHSMKTLEACLQYQVYVEQLIRILQKYDNQFVRSISPDITSTQAFLKHRIGLLQERGGRQAINPSSSRTKNVDTSMFQRSVQ